MTTFRSLIVAALVLWVSVMAGAEPAPSTSGASSRVGSKFPITLWYSLPAEHARVLESFVGEYRSSHDYLEITTKNFSTPEQLYRALTGGQERPTLALMEASWLPHVNAGGKLMSVEDWMPREQFLFSWSVKHDVYKPLFDASSIGEKLMARPFCFTTRALIYNTDLFKSAGVAAPPGTWEQVVEASTKIAKSAQGVIGFALADHASPMGMARNLQVFTWQAGGELVTSSGRSAGMAGLEKALGFLKSAASAGPVPDANFVAEQVGMYPGTVEDYLRLRQRGLPVKTAGLPGPDAQNRTTEVQLWSLGMFDIFPQDQLYKVQEMAFWLLDFAQQRRWAEQTPYLAAHVKVFDNPFYRRERLADHAALRVFLNVLGRSRVVDTAGQAHATLESFGKEIPALLRGDKTVGDVVDGSVSVIH